MSSINYEHPQFLTIQTTRIAATMSAAAVATIFNSSTLKVWTKALVLGCTFVVASGGSVGGTATVAIRRGTSISQAFPIVLTATPSGSAFDCSLATGRTLESAGEFCTLSMEMTPASLADRGFVINELVWRYRMLPQALPANFLV